MLNPKKRNSRLLKTCDLEGVSLSELQKLSIQPKGSIPFKSKVQISIKTENPISKINLRKSEIRKDKKIIKINPQEKKILEKMLETPGKVFSRQDIGKIINISKERTIDVMITRLRQIIEVSPKNPKYLQTIRGSGYALWIE